jgi:hypothetical protein
MQNEPYTSTSNSISVFVPPPKKLYQNSSDNRDIGFRTPGQRISLILFLKKTHFPQLSRHFSGMNDEYGWYRT